MEATRRRRLLRIQHQAARRPQIVLAGAHVRRRRRSAIRKSGRHQRRHRGVVASRPGIQRQRSPRRMRLQKDPGRILLARGVRRRAVPRVRAVRQTIVRVQGHAIGELRFVWRGLGVQRGQGAGGRTEGLRD